MALQFLADHCVPNSVIQTLREANHEILRVKDVLPVESPDARVIAKAQEIGAILLSLNGDFADIVTYSTRELQRDCRIAGADHPEVLPHLMARLTTYLDAHRAAGH